MIFCTRRIEFDAAHRVIGHEGKCRFLHGHRYILEVTFSADKTDLLGRVIDFGYVKDKIKKWIDENFDHNAILCENDRLLGDMISSVTDQNVFYIEKNPTAENIVEFLFYDVLPELFKEDNVKISEVKLYETPNCSAIIN